MAVQWSWFNDYCAIGVDFNASYSDTSVTINPAVYRYDTYATGNYGGTWSASCSVGGSNSGRLGENGTNWTGSTHLGSTGSKTCNKGESSYTVSVTVDYTSFGSAYNGSFHSLGSGSKTFSLTIPALESYVVSFDANEGKNAPESQTKWHSKALTLTSDKPSRTGYAFQGWATSKANANAGTVAYEAGDTVTANTNEALTLYAVWKAYELTISYDANGGTDIHLSQVKTYAEDLTIYTLEDIQSNGYDLKRTGWTFDSWNTASDGTGTQFNFGDAYTDDSKIEINDASITLYAQWNKKSYELVFDANLGELGNVPTSLTKTYDETLILPTEEPARELWNFLGWSDDSKGAVLYTKGAAYTDDSPLIPDVQTITSVTLYAVWELAYISPTIADLTVCRNNGTEDDEKGTYIHLTGSWNVDTTIQTDAVADGLIIEYKVSDADTWIEASNTNPNAQSGTIDIIIGEGTILPSESYFVRVTVTDWGGEKSNKAILPQQFRTFDVGNNGKSVGFGMPADDDVEGMDISMDVRFHDSAKNIWGNIPMKPIVRGEDLNDYRTVGFYYSDYSQQTGDSILNMPPAMSEEVAGANASFTLEVLYGGAHGALMQRATSCDMEHSIICQRMFYGDVWGEWRDITFNGQKVLWSHPRGVYMNADQSAVLDETISQQQNGIVFVFSAFDEENATALDYQWQFKFVPKHFALQNYTTPSANKGVCFVLAAKAFQHIATKYLYIYDETIQGDASNGENGTADCGITYNNTHWVLRYILGC